VFAAPQHRYTRACWPPCRKLGAMQGSDLPRKFDLLRAEASGGAREPFAEPQDTVQAAEPRPSCACRIWSRV
jgi:hypothetical protein